MTSEVFNLDCMIGMKAHPDKYFDLAIVDPPYGIGEGNKKNKTRSSYTGFGDKKTWVRAKDYGGGEWDFNIPSVEYFNELFRISVNQIIWGANYMVEYLDASMGWIVWDKDNGESDQSDCELAYSSFNRGLRKYRYRWQGLLQENMKSKEERIHPTQKPVALYSWIYKNYLPQGGRVIDTHLGSGSNRIAADKANNIQFCGYEIDKDYYEAQEKRWKNYKAQLNLFA